MESDDYRRDADRQQIDAGGKVVAAIITIITIATIVLFGVWAAFGYFEVLPMFAD